MRRLQYTVVVYLHRLLDDFLFTVDDTATPATIPGPLSAAYAPPPVGRSLLPDPSHQQINSGFRVPLTPVNAYYIKHTPFVSRSPSPSSMSRLFMQILCIHLPYFLSNHVWCRSSTDGASVSQHSSPPSNRPPPQPRSHRRVHLMSCHHVRSDDGQQQKNTQKCFGYNKNGELGLGDNANRGDGSGGMGDLLADVDLGAGAAATAVSAGLTHTCALLDGGSVKCWGKNYLC